MAGRRRNVKMKRVNSSLQNRCGGLGDAVLLTEAREGPALLEFWERKTSRHCLGYANSPRRFGEFANWSRSESTCRQSSARFPPPPALETFHPDTLLPSEGSRGRMR